MVKKTWIACNACGADAFKVFNSVGNWDIGKCTVCNLVYVNPIPVFEPSKEFSQISLEFQYTQYMHKRIPAGVIAFEHEQLQFQVSEVVRLMGQQPDAFRFLDLGCGSGVSVKAATDLGWQATGIDLDPELIQAGREQFDVDLRCSQLLDNDLGDNSVHFVRLRDVIEHLPNPYEVLLEAMRVLVPGGIVLITSPNQEGLISSMRFFLKGKVDRVATVTPPHHLHGFTPQTLKRIVDRTGFKYHQVFTTSPVDSRYVTSNNMRSANNLLYRAIWSGAVRLNRGSMLVGWFQKPAA